MNTGLSYHEEKDFENMNNEDSSHPEQGEQGELYRWVKASERLPSMETVLYLRRHGVMDLGNFYEQDQCYFLYIQKNGAHDEYTVPYSSPVNGDWEWLCKLSSPPPEGQDELAQAELWEDVVRFVEGHYFNKTKYPIVYKDLFSKYLLIKK